MTGDWFLWAFFKRPIITLGFLNRISPDGLNQRRKVLH